nr:unnamed protein product [Callosobruchus analis]
MFLKFCLTNTRSILLHFTAFKDIFEIRCDIIAVSGTWLKPDVSDAAVQMKDYKFYRKDRLGKRGGGLDIYEIFFNVSQFKYLLQLLNVFGFL